MMLQTWRTAWTRGHLLGLLSVGCISTELEPGIPSPVSCMDSVDEGVARDSVVLIKAQIGAPGAFYCSGVVIAPRLVVTASTCLAALNDPASSDPRAPLPPSVYPPAVDHATTCDRGMGWSPQDDGSFVASIGRRLEPRAVTVYAGTSVDDAGEDAPAHPVEALFTSGAPTSCKDNLAVLVLEAPLALAPVPVRLDETTEVREPVLMSGFCAASPDLFPEATPAVVRDITFDEATLDAPSRSLVLSRRMTVFSYGGGVFAAKTGALVGVIASGDYAGCGQGGDGVSFASRVSAFRRLIIEAASAADQPLHAELERGTGGSPALPVCPDTSD